MRKLILAIALVGTMTVGAMFPTEADAGWGRRVYRGGYYSAPGYYYGPRYYSGYRSGYYSPGPYYYGRPDYDRGYYGGGYYRGYAAGPGVYIGW